jgi:hypothetical protein
MTFKDREEAFESKYKHDEDIRFRTNARRDKLFGLWVAEQLGLSGDEAQHYARTVVQSDIKNPGDEDVLGKVRADLKDAGVEVSDHRLHKRLEECFEEARQQIMAE